MKVLIPQDIREAGKIYLKERGYDVVLGSGFDEETLKREIADADAVIMRTALYTESVIATGKKLKIMARYGVGLDNVDIPAAEKRGIYVTSAKNCNMYSVAEHAIMLMLTLARSQVYIDNETRKGGWNLRNSVSIFEMKGKTIGIIGIGSIGTHTAKIAHDGFDMNVVAYDPYADKAKLPAYVTLLKTAEDLFRTADVICLHIPYTPETHHMINTATLKMMKPSAYVINCGRGGIVNEEELYEALRDKVIAGAALDVFEQEPMDISNKLLTLSNFVVTPHNAGLTEEASDAMALSCAQAVDDVLNGRRPMYPVNNPANV